MLNLGDGLGFPKWFHGGKLNARGVVRIDPTCFATDPCKNPYEVTASSRDRKSSSVSALHPSNLLELSMIPRE